MRNPNEVYKSDWLYELYEYTTNLLYDRDCITKDEFSRCKAILETLKEDEIIRFTKEEMRGIDKGTDEEAKYILTNYQGLLQMHDSLIDNNMDTVRAIIFQDYSSLREHLLNTVNHDLQVLHETYKANSLFK